MALHASKDVSVSDGYVNTMMKQEHGVNGKALAFKASKTRSTFILFLCQCQTDRQICGETLFAFLILERKLCECHYDLSP